MTQERAPAENASKRGTTLGRRWPEYFGDRGGKGFGKNPSFRRKKKI